ncbi:SCO family protein [Haloarcula sp. CBA1130]|uniref:SCO family protein n=1 Tax=unclassified Haloarcula TaxID=2624677 RepID=UPI0012469C67|nr:MULTISPECIES: SCO family protein [unclassified Haloarcula]KAA9395841.1 SCO family protein [Haloarcula sp. CBA1129]KAA9400229.1 SCO family protein [Haloarcula sp. CBA1130]
MRRRTVLKSTGAVGTIVGVAGCLGGGRSGDSNPDVVLEEPDREFESSDVPYPAWGEQIPDVSISVPADSEDIRLRDVETPALLTFFYSHCQTVCPVLISTQRNIQSHAQNNGYADAVRFLPITFDPDRDTADRLGAYADEMNVDADSDNWQFLRPASKQRATDVIQDQFGVVFQRTEPENMDMYMFTHTALTLLVNADGYVERAYRSKSPDEETIISDLQTVRNA